VRPGHNSFSHLVCSLSKVLHVTWLDGWGVAAPWPSPFVPHVCIGTRMRRWPAVRRCGLLVWLAVGAVFLARIAGRLVARAFTLEKSGAVRKSKCARKSRFAEITFLQPTMAA
jgi:hypothetical protein